MSARRRATPDDLTAPECRRDPYLESLALAATEARLGRPVTVEEATVARRRTREDLAGASVGSGSSLPPAPVDAPRGHVIAERAIDWDDAGYYRPVVYRLDPPLHATSTDDDGVEVGYAVTYAVASNVALPDQHGDPWVSGVEIWPCEPDGALVRGSWALAEVEAGSHAEAWKSIGYDVIERNLAPTAVARRGAQKEK